MTCPVCAAKAASEDEATGLLRERHIAALVAALPQWQRETIGKTIGNPERYGLAVITVDVALDAMAALAASPTDAKENDNAD